jgi:hypothetical protein
VKLRHNQRDDGFIAPWTTTAMEMRQASATNSLIGDGGVRDEIIPSAQR